jgi:hypothetical protein
MEQLGQQFQIMNTGRFYLSRSRFQTAGLAFGGATPGTIATATESIMEQVGQQW